MTAGIMRSQSGIAGLLLQQLKPVQKNRKAPPEMINYAKFIGKVSSRRQPSIIRELLKILATASPEMIPLSGGLPNPEMFPFKEATFTLKDGSKVPIKGEAMNFALQYLPTQGHGSLVERLKVLQRDVHGINPDDYELITTNGSQDGLCKSLEMMTDPDGTSTAVLEDHTFFATLSILNPYKSQYVKVETDAEGMKPDSLFRELNRRWQPGEPGVPRFIYTNPTGQNPAGTVLPIERKREIYDICNEYDMIILEDDPYFYMQFGGKREPSFLSIDSDKRVIRFDSFSKVMSSGIRMGFVTGPKPLVDKIVLHLQVSVLHASSLSQVLVLQLLNHWGHDGFMNHIHEIEGFYEKRRDAMIAAAERHLTGLCEWNVPKAGMFLWIKVLGVEDTWKMIMEDGLKNNIMLVPGKVFMTPDSFQTEAKSPYLRASYSLAPVEKFDVAFARLAQLIKGAKANVKQ